MTIPEKSPREIGSTQEMEPVYGMLVTIFTSQNMTGIQAVTGEQSIEQIEELYHTNCTGGVILCGFLILSIIMVAIPQKKCV